jgi:hypothetical protein
LAVWRRETRAVWMPVRREGESARWRLEVAHWMNSESWEAASGLERGE